MDHLTSLHATRPRGSQGLSVQLWMQERPGLYLTKVFDWFCAEIVVPIVLVALIWRALRSPSEFAAFLHP